MTVQACELVVDEYVTGVVLVCTTSEVPLGVSWGTFASLDDAEAFIGWCSEVHGDPRTLDCKALELATIEWRARP